MKFYDDIYFLQRCKKTRGLNSRTILNFPIFPRYDSHLTIQLNEVLRVKVKWKDEEMKEVRGIF